MAALRDGKSQRAVSLLTGAVDTCPTNVEARQGFAEALWQQGEQQEAIAQLEKAWNIDPGEPLVAIQLGELYLREGKPAKSFAFAQAAIDLQPDLASAWLLRAKSREMLNQPEQALADYQHALGLEPENSEVLFQIAKSYHRSHQRERSMAALHRLMSMHPPGEIPGDIEYLCGVVCQEQGHHAQAIEHLQMAAASGISTAELSSRLGESAIMVGNFPLAEKSANEALRHDPQNVAAAQLMQRLASEQRETWRR